MGIAILSGILSSLSTPPPTPSPSGTSTPYRATPTDLPSRLPTRFIACVRRPESASRIKQSLTPYTATTPITILQDENLRGVQAADIVLLCCKPQMVNDILSDPDIERALRGKLLISICAGVTVEQLKNALQAGNMTPGDDVTPCTCVRAMPNTASGIRESMTVVCTSTPPLPESLERVVTWVFNRIGRVVYLPASAMDASTALCGSGPAFFALILEAIADGAVAMGLPRAEAQLMAAQTMRGTAGMVLGGEHPALVREKVGTPGGCTIGGLLVLEEGRVRGTVARAVREATVVASQLGRGVQGVNGTRF
ncbi:Pyrroline-5-carboxylate reductase [Glutinoglossum americanum]|uniref:Pyrroline-5-carboxylate reductase n=1 Tax=Glutinoglossum americanum TaxID=1670608 RepID=A0A9P8L5R4_9PEZI|nr:Pyrroline-5-carboxylate reductase [Glutinoglossum americanum]